MFHSDYTTPSSDPRDVSYNLSWDECGGVRVHFPPTGSSNDEVRITGPQDDVERAKKMIVEMANETVQLRGGSLFYR